LQDLEEDRNMSEKEILIAKRKYWAQFMKYNLAYTIFFGIALTLIFMTEVSGTSYERLILFYIPSSWLWIFASWQLSIIMYVYHSLKIHEITKPKVLAKSSEISLRSTQKHNGAMGEGEITRLKSIADLRDSGVLTDDEFQEQKSRILAESTGLSSNQAHYSGEGEPPMEDSPKNSSFLAISIIATVLFVIGFILMSYPSNDEEHARVIYSECWTGVIIDTYMNSKSIEGCGNETFSCGTGSGICVINAQKQEDNEKQLCVEVGDKRACTTAGYGIAQV
jgi:hypothetical protein